MNDDMYDAMKADDHAVIRYRLIQSSPGPLQDSGWVFHTRGVLSIAGVSREEEIDVTITPLPHGEFQVTGRKELVMSDFGIEPPTAFFGLIRVHQKLTVRFDIIAVQDPCSVNMVRGVE